MSEQGPGVRADHQGDIMTITETGPYSSMAALRTANALLAEQRRSAGEGPDLVVAAETFVARGSATGALLSEEDARWSAQGLLDYWAAAIERAGGLAPDATLAEFDPLLAPELPDSACPYRGLDAFNETNTGIFFGRQRVVAELVERLRDHRLLAVVGPSGSGKSSLVRAGLLPALRTNGVPGSAGWQILPPMVPGSDPSAALDRALTADDGSGAPLLLLIDQFEETFTLCTDEVRRTEFLNHLVALATDKGMPHRVVLTMRSDFEPFIARAEALHPLYGAGKVTLPPLTAGELRETIERPAEQVGLKFEAGVVDSLLGDILGEPAALPLLQYSLLKLWDARERNRVTLAAYKQVGGGRLALARGADAAYAALIPEEQVTARRILLRLVRPGEGLEITSNRVRRAELDRGGEDPGRVARVLGKLVDARLLRLTPGDTLDDTQVEVAHEALVRNWPTLVEWLEDERLSLRHRQRLSAAAEQWQRLSRDPAALLAGRLLEEARGYEDLSAMEREFVGAGVAAEAARARRVARTSLMIRVLLVITTIASVVATILAVQANKERDQAQVARSDAVVAQSLATTAQSETERQRVVIDSQRLAFASQTQIRDNTGAGLLLAYEASACDDNPVTGQTLRDTIDTVQWRLIALIDHTSSVSSAVFSPDGQRILTASADNTARLWNTAGTPLSTLSGHTASVWSAVFSPDGQRILTASADKTARLWDAAGTPLSTLSGHTEYVWSAVFSPDGQRILTASGDGTARLWDAVGTPLATLSGHTSEVWSAVFSPDGQRILTASADHTARLWDAAGTPLATLSGHTGSVFRAVFSPDGQHILTADDNTARLWDTAGTSLATLSGHTGGVNSTVFSPDGQRILTASADKTARLWDAAGTPLATLSGYTSFVESAVFSPDGQRILTTSGDGTARLWEAAGTPLATLSGHTGEVWSAVFSPDGQRILTASQDDNTARLWDAVGTPLATLSGHTDSVNSAVFSPDGQRILTASTDTTVRLWDASGQPLATLSGHTGGVNSAVFSPDGQRILTASDDGTARLWNAAGMLLATLSGHISSINNLPFVDPSGRPLATISVTSAVFSSDGQRILTASRDGTARLWDAAGTPLSTLSGHTDSVNSAVFSLDGTRILTVSADNTARLWDAAGMPLATLSGHTGSIYRAVFSPDGTRILTASADNTARLWDAAGTPLATLSGHTDSVNSAVFSPDGMRILTASQDGTARQYLVSSEDLRRAAACRVNRGLTDEEVARFQVPTPLTFDFAARQCPPVYSWQQGTK